MDKQHDQAGAKALREAQAIDSACDRFEVQLRENGEADFRGELDQIDPFARPKLFKQLLGLQMSIAPESRSRKNLPGLVAEFPEFRDEIYEQLAGGHSVRTIRSDLPAGAEVSGNVLDEIQSAARYQIGGEVARGGMGAIHLAEEASLRRNVAVKTMLMAQATPEETARFIEEAQITGQLDHPGIVPVHELAIAHSHPTGERQFSEKSPGSESGAI